MSLRLSKAQAARLGIKLPGASIPGKSSKKKTRHRLDDLSHLDQAVVEFSLPLKSQTKHRPRFVVDEASVRRAFGISKGNVDVFMKNVRTKAVTSKKTKEFENEVARVATVLMMGKAPLWGPVELFARFVLPGDEDLWPISRNDGDLDNHEKSLFDALNDVAYLDDCVIVRKITEKVFGGSGVAEIQFYAVPATNPTSLLRYLDGNLI